MRKYSNHRASSSHQIASPLLPSVYGDDRLVMNMEPMNTIPRILHFMWKDRRIPKLAVANLNQWRSLHPNWTFVLWTDVDLTAFTNIVLQKSSMLKVYESLPRQFMKVDFARYLILHTIGGVYTDIDVRPLRSLESLIRQHSCIVAREPEAFSVAIAAESAILASNFLLASRPGHPIWPYLMDRIRGTKGDVLFRTGPVVLSDTLRAYKNNIPFLTREASVFLAPSLYFDPPPSSKGDALHIAMLKGSACPFLRKQSYMTTYAKYICKIIDRESRIDWSVSYRMKRHYNSSFTRHLMFNTYGMMFRTEVRSVESLNLRLLDPKLLVPMLNVSDPYFTDRMLTSGNL